jgi:hypothetical protein
MFRPAYSAGVFVLGRLAACQQFGTVLCLTQVRHNGREGMYPASFLDFAVQAAPEIIHIPDETVRPLRPELL